MRSVRKSVQWTDFGDARLGGLGRQGHQRDVGRHGEFRAHVPARLIEQEHGVGAGREGGGDLIQVQVHGRGVTAGQNEVCALAERGADRAEQVGRGGALVLGC